jgi:putative toxin-antitoxin system antitoxin component (TIGR02293 family)
MATSDINRAEDVLQTGRRKVNLSSLTELHELVQHGVPASAVDRLERFLQLSSDQTVRMLGVSSSTRKRLKAQPRRLLAPDVTDRLVRVVHVARDATEVFGDTDRALRWLKAPVPALGDRAPFELMNTYAGVMQVQQELIRIKHGMWA